MHSNDNLQGPPECNKTNLQAKVTEKHRPSQREKKEALNVELRKLNYKLAIEQEEEKQTKFDL